jgi:hypothetical protein
VVLWSFILFGFTIVVFGAVRATGAVMAPLVILFVSMWLIRLPFAWLLGPHIGAESIWWSFPLGRWCRCCSFGYYRYGNWRRSHILPVAPHPKRWGMHPTPAWACHARMPMRARKPMRSRDNLPNASRQVSECMDERHLIMSLTHRPAV